METTRPAPPGQRLRQRRQLADRLAADQGGVVSREQLRASGVDRNAVQREVAAGRWVLHGTQTVAVHRRSLTAQEQWWRAIFEVGDDVALLDGVSALLAHGLTGFAEYAVHVSVVHRHHVPHPRGVLIHKLGERCSGEGVGVGVPRVRAPLAAVRAAHWATSDRQAGLVLAMTVQQGLATPAGLAAALRSTKHRRRRSVVAHLIADLAGGARSLGELDFGRLCREHGIPEPERQVVRRGPRGRIYLDVRWPCGLVVEIDGSGHREGLSVTMDNIRQNSVVIGGEPVLRIDLLGLRLWPDAFMSQVTQALAARGC